MLRRLTGGALIAGIAALHLLIAPAAGAQGALPAPPAPVPDELRTHAPAWAWCGVDPAEPNASAIVTSLARDSGIDVTFGPCLRPPDDYSPIAPGERYASPAVYRDLVELNASAGIRTVVFDERLWSDKPNVQVNAIAEWTPYLAWIEAWDLGDEYDPEIPEQWEAIQERFARVRDEVTPLTGVEPFTNHLHRAAEQALVDIPGSDALMSFALYFPDLGVALAQSLDSRVDRLMCGVNAMDHTINEFRFAPTPTSVIAAGQVLQRAGCDILLVFGGVRPYDTDGFEVDSLVDAAGVPTALAAAVRDAATRPDDGLLPIEPARLLDTRTAEPNDTVDGLFRGIGTRAAGSTIQLQVTDRAGVPLDATAVAVNTTVADPSGPGFVTVYPCGQPRPNTSVLNHGARELQSAFSVVALGAGGSICVYNHTATEVIVDVTGYHSPLSRYRPIAPGRLLDTRPGYATVDGVQQGIGRRSAGSVTPVTIAGRHGVPAGASGAMVTVTATEVGSAGYVTVFPCDEPRPTASNLNVDAGATEANTAWVGLDSLGRACLFTLTDAEVLLDVAGWAGPGHRLDSVTPARLLETRLAGGSGTVDGVADRVGRRGALTTTPLLVAGRGGVPSPAGVVALNVTVTEPTTAGFVTVFTCGAPTPPTSSLNFVAGSTVANLVMVRPADDGTVCFYTMSDTEIIVDVTGGQSAQWPAG